MRTLTQSDEFLGWGIGGACTVQEDLTELRHVWR